MLAYLWKWPCRFGGVWNGGAGQFTHYCYTDIYPLFWAEHLNEGKIPYVDYPVEYPVGIGAIMEFARRLAGGDGVRFYDVTVLLMGLSLVAGVLLMAALAGSVRPWDAFGTPSVRPSSSPRTSTGTWRPVRLRSAACWPGPGGATISPECCWRWRWRRSSIR